MLITVLGSAAGGGFPQWNCHCAGCRRAFAGDPAARPRTQSSLAVSADGESWVLLNATPDLRQQILNTPVLHPRQAPRHSPIAAVVLSNADVDHVTGLLVLRESYPFTVHATPRIQAVLAANRIFDVLNRDLVRREPLSLGRPVPVTGPQGPTGITVEVFAVPGKIALYLEEGTPDVGAETEDTVGLRVSAGDKSFFYIPGCAQVTPALADRLRGSELVFFDGTLWTDDEMIRHDTGIKTGRRMGHISVSGPGGTIAAFAGLDVRRKVFIHINNTNPMLLDDAPERAEAEAAGWTVAHDGLSLTL